MLRFAWRFLMPTAMAHGCPQALFTTRALSPPRFSFSRGRAPCVLFHLVLAPSHCTARFVMRRMRSSRQVAYTYTVPGQAPSARVATREQPFSLDGTEAALPLRWERLEQVAPASSAPRPLLALLPITSSCVLRPFCGCAISQSFAHAIDSLASVHRHDGRFVIPCACTELREQGAPSSPCAAEPREGSGTRTTTERSDDTEGATRGWLRRGMLSTHQIHSQIRDHVIYQSGRRTSISPQSSLALTPSSCSPTTTARALRTPGTPRSGG